MPDIKDLAVYYHAGRPDSNCSLCVYTIEFEQTFMGIAISAHKNVQNYIFC